jgi:hypothetical protein
MILAQAVIITRFSIRETRGDRNLKKYFCLKRNFVSFLICLDFIFSSYISLSFVINIDNYNLIIIYIYCNSVLSNNKRDEVLSLRELAFNSKNSTIQAWFMNFLMEI